MTAAVAAVPRFARGYFLSDPSLPNPMPDWPAREVAGMRLSHAPDLAVTEARSGDHAAVVLGHAIDTERWASLEDALSTAVAALARSEDEFLDVTDAWSGRYVIVFGTPGALRLMTDATAMRSAFYALEGPVAVASHARMVGVATGAPPLPLWAEFQQLNAAAHSPVAVPPGRSTPWAGVVYLTANQVLDLDTRTLRRIYPRRPPGTMTVAEAAARIGPLFARQVRTLVDTGRPVVISLTGGLDSRVTVAASREVSSQIGYFTYRRPGKAETDDDITMAQQIARTAGLSHRVLEVARTVEPPELDDALREATILGHGRATVAAYRTAFSADTMHIRSNVGEVGRCFYRGARLGGQVPQTVAATTAEHLALVWARGAPVRSMVDAFQDWMDASAFQSVEGLDPLEIFYWEHRLSCWHSNLVLESDFATDTHVIFNARSILSVMLSVRGDAACGGALLRQVIADLWPELLQWPTRRQPARRGLREKVLQVIGRR